MFGSLQDFRFWHTTTQKAKIFCWIIVLRQIHMPFNAICWNMYCVVNFCNDLRVFTTLFHMLIWAVSSFVRFVFGRQYISFYLPLNVSVAGHTLCATWTNNYVYDFLDSLVIHTQHEFQKLSKWTNYPSTVVLHSRKCLNWSMSPIPFVSPQNIIVYYISVFQLIALN
jgi:hypothetical protein